MVVTSFYVVRLDLVVMYVVDVSEWTQFLKGEIRWICKRE